jgi:hypothetical protein
MKVDDETIIGTLITRAINIFDVNDEIFRVINALIKKQSQVWTLHFLLLPAALLIC